MRRIILAIIILGGVCTVVKTVSDAYTHAFLAGATMAAELLKGRDKV